MCRRREGWENKRVKRELEREREKKRERKREKGEGERGVIVLVPASVQE